jgi:hypothetical protein
MSFCTARVAPEKAVFRPALPLHSQPEFTGEQTMAKLTYKEQLLHPKWQRKRLETLNAAGWTCECCAATEITLHVHHKKYVRGRMAWEYERSELSVLCEGCHEQEHALQSDMDAVMAETWHDIPAKEMAHGFLVGFLFPFQGSRITDMAVRANRLPFFDVGFMAAALGPVDMARALQEKVARGEFPETELMADILQTINNLPKE